MPPEAAIANEVDAVYTALADAKALLEAGRYDAAAEAVAHAQALAA